MTSLAQYDRARAALAEATCIDEVLPIIDEIENCKRYARAINDQELVADATAYQMKAERQLGFIIVEAKKAGHFTEGRRRKNGAGDTEPLPPVATLAEVGVSKKLSARSQKRASIAERAFDLMVAATRERIASSNAVPVNGARAMAPGRKEPSASLDYSPTPPWATRALLELVLPAMDIHLAGLTTAHEPACGEGHMAEVLREYFPLVGATDIHDYGYGDATCDFLADDITVTADWIITNPPFKDKAEQFALKAIKQAKVGVAIFARLQWLETIGRYERLFRDHPPTQLAFFAERVNLCMGRWEPDGGTATAYIWLVWVNGADPRAPFWIPPGQQLALTRPDDAERFTAHPVLRRPSDSSGTPINNYNQDTGEIADDVRDDSRGRAGEPDPDRHPLQPVAAGANEAPRITFLPIEEVCCERDARHQEDDGLDIPAFLKRTANKEPAFATAEDVAK